jgi:tetratricopeptide (TPR) repeat protein
MEAMRTSDVRIAVLAGCLLVNPALAQNDAASWYRQGVDRQRAGDLNGALDSYSRVLALDAGNVAARSNRGAALARLGRYDEAIADYTVALQSAPAQAVPFLRRNLALADYKSGRLSEAAPILLELHRALPDDRNLTLLAADCLLQLGEPAKALELLEPLAAGAASGQAASGQAASGQAASDQALDKGVAYALGTAYLKVGKTAEAQRILDPILKDDASPEGRYALALAAFTSGDYPAAVRAFQRALALGPDLPHIQSYYGQALVYTGDPDGALEAFGKQLAADANDFDANFQAGMILSRRKAYGEAEKLLRKAVVLRPGSLVARFGLADTVLHAGRAGEAVPLLAGVLRESPDYGPAHARLGDAYASLNRTADAERERALAARYTPKAQMAGLRVGAQAPRLTLARADGSGSVQIAGPEPGKPTVLVFGSYSCPNFRKAAPVLNQLSKAMAGEAAFLQVYIREAHATDQWQSTINEREHVELAPVTSAAQKGEYAMMCQRNLHLSFASAVDSMDDAAEKAYDAWPSRAYVVGRDGTVLYSTALIEEEFDGARFEQAVRAAVHSRGGK